MASKKWENMLPRTKEEEKILHKRKKIVENWVNWKTKQTTISNRQIVSLAAKPNIKYITIFLLFCSVLYFDLGMCHADKYI